MARHWKNIPSAVVSDCIPHVVVSGGVVRAKHLLNIPREVVSKGITHPEVSGGSTKALQSKNMFCAFWRLNMIQFDVSGIGITLQLKNIELVVVTKPMLQLVVFGAVAINGQLLNTAPASTRAEVVHVPVNGALVIDTLSANMPFKFWTAFITSNEVSGGVTNPQALNMFGT